MAREPNLLQQVIRKIELLSMYERESSIHTSSSIAIQSSTERADTNQGFISMPQLHHFQY